MLNYEHNYEKVFKIVNFSNSEVSGIKFLKVPQKKYLTQQIWTKMKRFRNED